MVSLRRRGAEGKGLRLQPAPVRQSAATLGAAVSRLERLEQSEDLELAIAERTRELAARNAELEAFSYSLAHELSSPLRQIDGYTSLVLGELGSEVSHESRARLERVRAAGQRMNAIFAAVLRLARTGRAPLECARVDMAVAAHAAANAVREQHPAFEVSIEALPPCEGDAALLEQVFVNLFVNSMKFAAPSRPPRVEVGYSLERGGHYFVRDNGIGFDMAEAVCLFEPFRRLSGTEHIEGSGVGLSLVARIIERHGGRIWAEGTVGAGAKISFCIAGSRPE